MWCPRRSSLQDMLVNALEARGCRGGPLLWRHLVEHLSWNGADLLSLKHNIDCCRPGLRRSSAGVTVLCSLKGVRWQ